jgi:hypothetical protein
MRHFVRPLLGSFSTPPLFDFRARDFLRPHGANLGEAMARRGAEVEVVKPFQVADTFERLAAERRFPVEGVEHDAFEEVAESEVMVLGEGFEHLEDALFDAYAGLYALD